MLRLSLPRRGRVVAEGDRVGVFRLQRCVDRFQRAGQVLIDVVVPKARHAKPIADEKSVAHSIARGVIIEIVLAAIGRFRWP